jgi:hypothetical protein
MHGRRPISNVEMKKTASDCSARAIRTHLDDANLPVICPTSGPIT